MKTPKTEVSTPKTKLNTPINKQIKRSAGNTPFQKKKSKISIKGDQVANVIADKDQFKDVTKKKSLNGLGKKEKQTPNKQNQTPKLNQKNSPAGKRAKRESESEKPHESSTPGAQVKKQKKNDESPEVKLGLKIEKLLESPKSASKKKGKENKPQTPEQKTPGKPKRDFINRVTALQAVRALLEHCQKEPREKDPLFGDKSALKCTVHFFKLPHSKQSVHRVSLPHSLYDETADICLISCDAKGKKNDPEESIDRMRATLEKNGVNWVNEIIPLRKLATEYTQFEQKRKLVNQFDLMLVDAKICHRMGSLLRGLTKKKIPVPLKLDPENQIKKSFKQAISKVTFQARKKALTISITFGHSGLSDEQLADNLIVVSQMLANQRFFAGGAQNIRSMYIKTALSMSFPVYMSTVSPNEVITPEPIKSKKKQSVTDELSTFTDKKVTVYPDGRVKTRPIKEKKTEESPKKKQKQELKPPKVEDEEDDDEDEDDESGDEGLEVENLEELEDLSSGDDDDDDDDENDSEEDEELDSEVESDNEEIPQLVKAKKGEAESDEDSDDESDDEQESKINMAETKFLKELRKQQDEIVKMQADTTKKAKKNAQAKPVAKPEMKKKDAPPKKQQQKPGGQKKQQQQQQQSPKQKFQNKGNKGGSPGGKKGGPQNKGQNKFGGKKGGPGEKKSQGKPRYFNMG